MRRDRPVRHSVANLGADGDLARALAAIDDPCSVTHCQTADALAAQNPELPELPDLPLPILAHVLSYLPLCALSNARLVSRQWRNVASSDELWRAMYFLTCGEASCPSTSAEITMQGGWRRRTMLASRLGQPHAVSIRPVWGGLDGRLFGAPRSGHAAAVYRPRAGSPEQCLLVGGATTNYAYRRDADIFLPATDAGELETENCLGRLPAPPIDGTNVLSAWSARWLHTAVVVHIPASSRNPNDDLEIDQDADRQDEHSYEGNESSTCSSPQRIDVLLLIGGQQQQHVYTEVHRLELSSQGTVEHLKTTMCPMHTSERSCCRLFHLAGVCR